jgi:HlyD family secretion protein/epimerase transport system membrane fusion protein
MSNAVVRYDADEAARRLLDSARAPSSLDSLHRACAAPSRAGYLVTGLFGAVFGLWGGLVPLASGAMAPGIIAPETSRKTVQHLEGGIITKLAVRDGDTVLVGQALVELDSVQAQTTVDILRNQQLRLFARQARLDAEIAGAATVAFPAQLVTDGVLDPAARSQVQIFDSRRASMQARKDVLVQRLQQLTEQINAYKAQVKSTESQLELVREEGEAKASLVKRGLISKPEAFRLQRMDADLTGRHGELVANIARARQQIGETQMQLLALDAERIDQIADESDKVRLEIAELHQKLRSAEEVLRRTVIVAPVGGKIVNMRFKTIGGIVQRGEPILEIVPGEDRLVIEARVTPIDINVVHAGLPAQVHLGTHASRTLPQIAGVVRSVSADRIVDPHTKQSYYLARIEIDRDEVERLAGIELVSGMTADVLIVAKERSMLGYLVQPFRDALRRSLREV